MKKVKNFISKNGWLVVLAIIIPAGEILLLWPFIKNKFKNNKDVKKTADLEEKQDFLKAG